MKKYITQAIREKIKTFFVFDHVSVDVQAFVSIEDAEICADSLVQQYDSEHELFYIISGIEELLDVMQEHEDYDEEMLLLAHVDPSHIKASFDESHVFELVAQADYYAGGIAAHDGIEVVSIGDMELSEALAFYTENSHNTQAEDYNQYMASIITAAFERLNEIQAA